MIVLNCISNTNPEKINDDYDTIIEMINNNDYYNTEYENPGYVNTGYGYRVVTIELLSLIIAILCVILFFCFLHKLYVRCKNKKKYVIVEYI